MRGVNRILAGRRIGCHTAGYELCGQQASIGPALEPKSVTLLVWARPTTSPEPLPPIRRIAETWDSAQRDERFPPVQSTYLGEAHAFW